MIKLLIITFSALSFFTSSVFAEGFDRLVSVGISPNAIEGPNNSKVRILIIDLINALDKATQTKSKIVIRPFARSLKETADGHADFHIPIIRNANTNLPKGLDYLDGVNFPSIAFVIYSRKNNPLDAETVIDEKLVEVEAGHQPFFPFKVTETHCISCSLDKLLLGRINALIIAADVVDPMLKQERYKRIHRALYKHYPVTVLVPTSKDSEPVRQYFIDGTKRLREIGELPKGLKPRGLYVDWQPGV
jgi:hypothetical protein